VLALALVARRSRRSRRSPARRPAARWTPPTPSSRTLKEGKNADYIPALAKVDPNLFGIAVVTADGKVYTAGDVKTEVSIQSISKVFTMAQVIQEQGLDVDREADRRRRHRRALQLDHRDRRRRRSCGTGAPEMNRWSTRRDLGDQHGDRRDADAVWAKIIGFHNDAPAAADRAAGRLQVRVRHQPAQPGDRRADARLRLHQDELAAGRRSLHPPVLDRRQREGSGDDGGDAGVRRQEPGHRQAGHRRAQGAGRARGDGDRRPLRRLRQVAVSHGPAGQERRRRRHHRRLAGKFGIAVVSPPLDDAGNSVRAQKAIADISNALGGNPYAAMAARTDPAGRSAGASRMRLECRWRARPSGRPGPAA
jgi:glutaminase